MSVIYTINDVIKEIEEMDEDDDEESDEQKYKFYNVIFVCYRQFSFQY